MGAEMNLHLPYPPRQPKPPCEANERNGAQRQIPQLADFGQPSLAPSGCNRITVPSTPLRRSMKLTFLGATETVTGSKYLIEHGSRRVLVDCGLFQGTKNLRRSSRGSARCSAPPSGPSSRMANPLPRMRCGGVLRSACIGRARCRLTRNASIWMKLQPAARRNPPR